jgi:cyclophilin family peptidyl-prolyl cis-trans isomerase
MFKSFLKVLIISFMCVTTFTACSKQDNRNKIGVFYTTKGVFKITFDDTKAPVSAARVKELISSGFYNNMVFHRVIPGFIVQTGDPTGTGSGGSGQILKAEFNVLKHVKGTVGMARKVNDENSADSQFYITMSDSPHLDGKYTIIGTVSEGIEVVAQLTSDDKIEKAVLN